MNLQELRSSNALIDLFCSLAQIPSPTMKEDKVADFILEYFASNGIDAARDEYGNVIAKIKATDYSKKPLLLSAHMDVVGDDSPVNIFLNSNIIETDKKRTLGADNKAGVSSAMLLAKKVASDKTLSHGGIELAFTRDEEQTMSGVKHLDMKKFDSEYLLVLDADRMAQVQISGAGFMKLILNVKALKGGHSGFDIGDETRLNAVKLISELIMQIPQGAYKYDEYGVATSINVGAVVGGGVETALSKFKETDVPAQEASDFVLRNSMTNIINTDAGVIYSIRSTDKKVERELIDKVQKIVDDFNKKYENLASATLEEHLHLMPFEKSDDETIVNVARKAADIVGVTPDVSSFHAAAETHIYSLKTNSKGVKFKPCLIGVADIYNMHSSDEQLDYKSLLKGYEFLEAIFLEFNKLF